MNVNRSSLPNDTDLRARFLNQAATFVVHASRVPGVRRISLVGSIVTDKPNPKDIDLLVRISDDADLQTLAKLGRQLKGGLQQLNHTADVFLRNEADQYLGRTCGWRKCQPGIRVSCDADHCGARQYLHDDLQIVTLAPDLVACPPVDVYPSIRRRRRLPSDVERWLSCLAAELKLVDSDAARERRERS